MPHHRFLIFLFIYLRSRERQSQRNLETEVGAWVWEKRRSSDLLVHSPNACDGRSRMGVGETRSWEFYPGLSHGWQEPNCLSHYHCLPGSQLASSWNLEVVLETKPTCSDIDVGILIIRPTAYPTYHWCLNTVKLYKSKQVLPLLFLKVK